MASTGVALVIAAGSLTAANEAFFAPIAASGTGKNPPKVNFNWRIIPATAIVAVATALVDKINPKVATGIGILALVSVSLAPVGNADSPIVNLAKITGNEK
jgi:hypothetical protein